MLVIHAMLQEQSAKLHSHREDLLERQVCQAQCAKLANLKHTAGRFANLMFSRANCDCV